MIQSSPRDPFQDEMAGQTKQLVITESEGPKFVDRLPAYPATNVTNNRTQGSLLFRADKKNSRLKINGRLIQVRASEFSVRPPCPLRARRRPMGALPEIKGQW